MTVALTLYLLIACAIRAAIELPVSDSSRTEATADDAENNERKHFDLKSEFDYELEVHFVHRAQAPGRG